MSDPTDERRQRAERWLDFSTRRDVLRGMSHREVSEVFARDLLAVDDERASLRAALESAVNWLDYLADHIAVDWAPSEEAVMVRDRDEVRRILSELGDQT